MWALGDLCYQDMGLTTHYLRQERRPILEVPFLENNNDERKDTTVVG